MLSCAYRESKPELRRKSSRPSDHHEDDAGAQCGVAPEAEAAGGEGAGDHARRSMLGRGAAAGLAACA